jgi:hypothetical protein
MSPSALCFGGLESPPLYHSSPCSLNQCCSQNLVSNVKQIAMMFEAVLRFAPSADVVADAPWLLVLLYGPMLSLAMDALTLRSKTKYVQQLFKFIIVTYLDAEFTDSFLGICAEIRIVSSSGVVLA